MALVLAGVLPSLASAQGVTQAPVPIALPGHSHTLQLGPVDRPRSESRPQVRVMLPERSSSMAKSPSIIINPSRDAKLLVISAEGTETALSAVQQTLDFLGTPYTVWIAARNPGTLTPDRLATGSHALYQGVILVTGNLAYFDGTQWSSALKPEEWNTLWNFEAAFGVRQVTWYTYPEPTFGFAWPHEVVDTGQHPIPLTLTRQGLEVFPYFAPVRNPLTVEGAYTYLATLTSPDATPLLIDTQGNVLGAIMRYPDGRENLALTFDSSLSLVHSVVVGYGMINWVTRGVFLGFRRVYASVQVDDLFIQDEMWCNPVLQQCPQGSPTVRITGFDLQRAKDWQDSKQIDSVSGAFKLSLAFNGEGTTEDYTSDDTLTPKAIELKDHFSWISHTYTHPDLSDASYETTLDELTKNNSVAQRLAFPTYTGNALVTPAISGLDNPLAMSAARDTGVRYVISDTSRPRVANLAPNAGTYNALEPSILEIPRRPTNLYFNISTPEEWTSEYNSIYHSYWGRDLAYPEILEKESNTLSMYLIKGESSPWMFHQPNLLAYDGTHSLLSDLLDETLLKYAALYNLPLVSPTMDELGIQVANRTDYLTAGVRATIANGTITVTALRAAVVPVTGLRTATADYYGGQYTAFLPLSAGQSVTLPLQ